MPELWRPIPAFPHYEASSLGRIRSRDRVSESVNRWGKYKRLYRGQIRKLHHAPNGYLRVILCSGSGRRRCMAVHVLVAAAFIGPRPPGKVVMHKDNDKANPQAENLSYGTPQENREQAVRDGLFPRGEQQPNAKLTARRVQKIRQLARALALPLIASKFGVSSATVWAVVNGKRWRHVA